MGVLTGRGQNGLSLVLGHSIAGLCGFLWPGHPGWVQALIETSTVTAGNSDYSTGGNEFALSFRKNYLAPETQV